MYIGAHFVLVTALERHEFQLCPLWSQGYLTDTYVYTQYAIDGMH